VRGCDYSFSRPDPACLKRAGYGFVFRYLGRDPRGGKDLTRAEADRLVANGLKVAVVCQPRKAFVPTASDDGGFLAQQAHADAVACGMPPTRPIYFSVDGDTRGMSGSQWSGILSFFREVNSVISVGRTGGYGAKNTLETLRAAGLITYLWQTIAWSGGVWSPHAHVRQGDTTRADKGMNVSTCGGTIDINDSVVPDFGQWPIPTPPSGGSSLLLLT
jgi:Domain of unknown function (DUF1906)